MEYRRARTSGGTYFFTVVTHNRQDILCLPENVPVLREAFHYTRNRHPFVMDAVVILPDHLHCVWTLPTDDADYSTRWRLIKSFFSRRCAHVTNKLVSASRHGKHETTVWQRRFWEHQIRDETDYERHLDYIHYNPVKHGLAAAPKDWPYSSFHRYVEASRYPSDWGSLEPVDIPDDIGSE